MNTLLGQRIREQRKEKGWTIEQFAERVDLSANYVGDLERGVKIPKLETFIRIVEVLDVSADVLIRDSVPSASHVADDELSIHLQPQEHNQGEPGRRAVMAFQNKAGAGQSPKPGHGAVEQRVADGRKGVGRGVLELHEHLGA